MNAARQKIKVWDPFVRIGHWTLVIAFFTAYFTGEDFLTQHIWAGYIVGGVVLFRIMWGFIGSKHAKFKDFLYPPYAVFGYLKRLVSGQSQHYLGHNPAGGAMVLALLIGLSGTVYTGLKLYAIEKNAGPFAMLQNSVATTSIISTSNKRINENVSRTEKSKSGINESDEDFWEELHEFFVNFTLLLIVIHICGVIFSSIVDKENLIKAMVTGRKEIDQFEIKQQKSK